MMRIYTYVTLDAAGDPISAGTYFDIALGDFDAVPGNNMLIQNLRDGTQLMVSDPQVQFENSGTLMIKSSHVDQKSATMYGGAYRYLGAVLAAHYRNKIPLLIYMQSTQETHPKAFLVYLLSMDKAILAAATDQTQDELYLTRTNMPKVLNFETYIDRSGEFADYDDETSTTWGVRH